MGKYSKEFKDEALKLSDEIGVKDAAKQLGIAYYTLADWRSIRKNAQAKKEPSCILTVAASTQAKLSEKNSGTVVLFKASAEPDIALTTQEWRAFSLLSRKKRFTV